MATVLRDKDWIRQSFLLPKEAISEQDQVRRVLTDAQFKFTDTTLGGTHAINSPPQFTRYADLKVPGKNPSSRGMGRFYSESLDDHGQYVQMQFGVPQYNSLTNFFTNFYNPKASLLARTGRATSTFFAIGNAIGFVVTLPAQPIIWARSVYKFMFNKPVSRYYYLKPTMALYWDAVNTIANAVGVNMGVIPAPISEDEQSIRGEGPGFGEEEMRLFHNMMPDIYREKGGIDVYALANKAKRMEIRARDAVKNQVRQSTGTDDLSRRLRNYQQEAIGDTGGADFQAYINAFLSLSISDPDGKDEADSESTGTRFDDLSQANKFFEFAEAEFRDGGSWVTFRVDHTGTAQESFSNTVGESEISSKINEMSGAARSTRFSLAEGNVTGGIFDSILGAVGDVASGIANQLHLSGVAALGGSAFADIPKTWQGSNTELPSSTYTIELRSPYGTPLSRFQNLVIPVAMLLAGTLPLSTGRQSYTSPFICQVFSKGRSQARLGMITSLSITRGAGNTGWTRDNEPLGIDVSFTVTDMSTIMHMPLKSTMSALDVVAGTVAGAAGDSLGGDTGREAGELIALAAQKATYDDDNAFTDYLAVLGSLSYQDQVYSDNKWRLSMARRYAQLQSEKTPARAASWVMGNSLAGWVKQFAYATELNDR